MMISVRRRRNESEESYKRKRGRERKARGLVSWTGHGVIIHFVFGWTNKWINTNR
jgi:hypothetical protein